MESERVLRSVKETHCSASISNPVDMNTLGETLGS